MRLGERKIHANLDRDAGGLLRGAWQDLQDVYSFYLNNLNFFYGVTRVEAWKILYQSCRQSWPKLNSKQLQYARDKACLSNPPSFCPITLDYQSFSLSRDTEQPETACLLFWRNKVRIFGKSLKALDQAVRIRLIEIYPDAKNIWKVTITYNTQQQKSRPGLLMGLYLDEKAICLSSGKCWDLTKDLSLLTKHGKVQILGKIAHEIVNHLVQERTERIVIAALNRVNKALVSRCENQSIMLRALVKRCDEVGIIVSFTEPLTLSQVDGFGQLNKGSSFEVKSAQAILLRCIA